MRASVALAALGLLSVSLSCASTGTAVDSSLNATTTLRDSYQQLLVDVDKTVKCLDDIQAKKDTDLTGAYNAFVDAVNDLDSQTKTVQNASARLRSETTDYIKMWGERAEKIQNEAIRKVSVEAREATAKRFDSAKAELDRIASDYSSFTSDLKDLKATLYENRTANIVSRLKKVIDQTKSKAGSVKKDISGIVAALDKLADTMKTSKAPEEPKSGSGS